VTRFASYVGLIALLLAANVASAQKQVGDNVHLNASGLLSGGYSGVYGNDIESSHGIDLGLNGSLNGDYFNPNFLSFVITPYYNQSRADSSFQSLTGASGVAASANIFTGSHFPGSVSYHYDYNSTGTYGLEGVPNFTTRGTGQGFGVNWSLLFPNWPTFSIGYSQGGGNSTLYGTDQESSGHQRNLSLRSGYKIAGFLLNATFNHNTFDSLFPQFLAGQQESISNTSANDFGINASHNLPLDGTFATSYTHETVNSDYALNSQGVNGTTSSNNFTTQTENAFVNFHPTQRFGFSASESYTDNLSGYYNQYLINNGAAPVNVNLGTGSQSLTLGGGASYRLTSAMSFQAQANHYEQFYLGQNYSGTYISGGINFNRRLWDMFTFSAFMVDSSNANDSNSIGFVGNVNYFHRFGGWDTSGSFSYSQNVQTLLLSYTTSSYNYNGRLRHRLPYGLMWIASFNGSHSGFSQQQGTTNHSESYSTSLSARWLTLTGIYIDGSGNSLLSNGGLLPIPPTPGIPVNDLILYGSSSYGGSISSTPLRRLTVTGSFNRAISNTIGVTESHNNTEIFNAQVQYRLRRISLLSGWTRYSQGISAISTGPPGVTSSFFVGVSRWFNFF
jgi:hypothetical protein